MKRRALLSTSDDDDRKFAFAIGFHGESWTTLSGSRFLKLADGTGAWKTIGEGHVPAPADMVPCQPLEGRGNS